MKLSDVLDTARGVGVALCLASLVVLLASERPAEAAILSAIASALIFLAAAVGLWSRVRAARADDHDHGHHNCALCGKHQPQPPAMLIVSGRFENPCGPQAPGICIVWCQSCAAADSAYADAVECCREHDAPGLTNILRTVAQRGPGRLTWVSQAVVDRLNAETEDTPEERTMH